ncbi:MAG: hypothetical protein JXB26_05165 [Candidatus Aminicenantes bacterium]|nr:hypothetical protein [Candidatus Aminicenantes bacterium]
MRIQFFEPFSRGWNRMVWALFKPFDFKKWFIVGFTAFLAGLTDGFGKGAGNNGTSVGKVNIGIGDIASAPQYAWNWLVNHPGWFFFVGCLVFFLLGLLVLFLWLSSRGKFMFLYNVAHDKAEVALPWRKFGRLGDSIFLWRLVFTAIGLLIFFLYAVIFFTSAASIAERSTSMRIPVLFIIQMVLLFIGIMIVIGSIDVFMDSFVVPIMYKRNVKAVPAWGIFIRLLGRHFFHFILYALLYGLLTFFAILFVVIAGFMTCCIGLILLIIPYIGSVITLPVSYTFRAFSLEFLAQFGEDFNVFPPAKPLTSPQA